MAEGGKLEDPESQSWENWLGGWVQTAKEKSSSALEFVKKDLAEFTCTIQHETEKAVEKTRESLKGESTLEATNKVKAGFSSLLGNISKALVVPPDDDYVPMKVSSDGSLFDRGKARLHAIQLDVDTYTSPPRGPPEQFQMWLDSFVMDEHKGEISELLVSKVEVRALYTKLVPTEVSHAEFWQRYFYRVHQLQCDEARKQALMKRADQSRGDSIGWDDDDWSGGEEDDGNHSDWEKMPRPPQSEAAAQAREAKRQSELEASTPSQDTSELAKSETSFPPSAELSRIPEPAPDWSNERKLEKNELKRVEASSIEPAGGSPPVEKSNNDSFLASKPALPENVEEAKQPSRQPDAHTGGAEEKEATPVNGKPRENSPRSLHIPTDLASASQAVAEEGEINVTEAGSPSDSHTQNNSRGDSLGEDTGRNDECGLGAAAGGVADAAEIHQGKSDSFTAGGACGASEMVVSTTTQPRENPALSADIPGASVGVETAAVPEYVPVPPASEPLTQAATSEAEPVTQQEVLAEKHPDVPSLTVEVSDGDNFVPSAPTEACEEKEAEKEIRMRVKGDMVVVGERGSPSSESADSKELGLDEDWEQDFDIEVTEDDLKAAELIAKRLGENLNDDDDWENWE